MKTAEEVKAAVDARLEVPSRYARGRTLGCMMVTSGHHEPDMERFVEWLRSLGDAEFDALVTNAVDALAHRDGVGYKCASPKR